VPTVQTLDRKRATYLKSDRDLYEALYRGGHAIEAVKRKLLPQRPAEQRPWYDLRLQQFHYLPRVAQILDELAASVFQGDLEVLPRPAAGQSQRPSLPPFYEEFSADPLGGNRRVKLVDLLYRGVLRAQVHHDHFYRVLFPDVRLPEEASRADQESAGGLRARLEEVHADAVLDFKEDAAGRLLWVKLAYRICDDDPLRADSERRDLLRWEIIDRERIRVFELQVEAGKDPKPGEEVPQVREDLHRWAAAQRVPVVRMVLGDDVWLMDRLGSMAVAETRKRNGLHWYEELCCYPQPVHLGEETLGEIQATDPNVNRARGATVWLEGGKEDEFSYLEPTGESLAHLAGRLESMGHEIATVVHQAASALGPEAARQLQSAASKVRDSVAKRLIADCYADDVKKVALELYELVSIGRGEDYGWEVLGLEQHDLGDVEDATGEAQKVQGLRVPSETFWRRYWKRFIRRALPGEPAAEYEKMDREIETADLEGGETPDRDEEPEDEDPEADEMGEGGPMPMNGGGR
jgi:hypothetical protein